MPTCLPNIWRIPLLVLLCVPGACAAFRRPAPQAPPVPAAAPLIPQGAALARIFSAADATTASLALESPHPAGAVTTLTLAEVEELALHQNPTFKEFEASRASARAELLQALAYPNPELEAGAGFATTREAPHKTALEYGLGLFQTLEWPSKRKTRREAAAALAPIVQREEDAFRATLRADVAKAYHTVLFYQHGVELARAALGTEHEIEIIVRRRVEAGEAPQIDLTKAQVESLKASRAVQAQLRQLETARAILNTLAGRVLPAGFALQDTLEQALRGADLAQARQIALAQHPTLRRLDAVVRQRELAIAREQKAWYPDLKVGLSPDQEIDKTALGATLGLELPFWNRNQAGIAAARAELQKAQAELGRTRQEILRDLETGAQTYESAREQLIAFRGGLRAAAAEALHIATFLYQEGEADFLQLLDARRTDRQTEAEYLQSLYDANIARAELERAIGIGGNQE